MERVVLEDDQPKAFLFVKNMEYLLEKQKIKETNPRMFEDYQKLVNRAKLVALPVLSDEEVLNILENNIVSALDIELYDLWYKLKSKLINIYNLDKRSDFRERCYRTLEKNKQFLTREPILKEERPITGEVANWLAEYRGETEDLRKADKEIRSGFYLSIFFTRNKSYGRLSPEEKERVKKILELYEKLRIPSHSLEGMEELIVFVDEKGEMSIFKEGVMEKVKAGEKIETARTLDVGGLMAEIKNALKLKEYEEAPVNEELNGLKGARLSEGELINYLDSAFKAGDKIKVLAALFFLAEEDKLDDFMKHNDYFKSIIMAKLSAEEQSSFALSPVQPKYLRILLNNFLSEQLRLTGAESAKLALNIVNHLPKEKREFYKGVVYFNIEKKSFEWRGD